MKKETQEYLQKVVTIKLRGNSYFKGILIDAGSKWVLLRYIPNDYVIDGYVLINVNYISEINISETETFTEVILKLKNVDFNVAEKFDLENTDQLLKRLKEKSILVSIELKDHQKSYVGLIKLEREKSMKVHLINKRCDWLKEETFLYNELRAIYFEDDYLHSLELFLQGVRSK